MSEPTDAEIAAEEDKALEGQIADHEEDKRNPPPPDEPSDYILELRLPGREGEVYEWALAGLTELTNALRLAPVPEHDWATVANHLRTIEVDLGEKRREIEQEATDVAQASRTAEPMGKKLVYESDRGNLVEQTTRVRSFNTSGILAAIAEGLDAGPLDAIVTAVEAKALELKWKVKALENVADRLEIDLPTTHHEIEDGDPDYLVGVVSTSKMVRG